jgi:glycosyltransferase involved in cell wall biosynthesis
MKSGLFIVELLLLKLVDVKLVWTVHNIVCHEQRQVQIELFFNRLLLRLCNHVIVHCQAARYEVIQTYKLSLYGKMAIIPHGHFIDHYKNQISQAHARSLLQVGQRDTVFLFFGAIRAYKRVPELVEAFKKLKSRRARLLIVGSPGTKNDIGTQIEEQCKKDRRVKVVLEFVPSDQIQVYINASDVVVMPFQKILTSGSVLLAMGFAKAIVAPRLGCLPEMLNEKGAILYDPNDTDGLHGALEKACGLDREPQKRAHSPPRFTGTAGLASESENGQLPNGRREALPAGRTFSAAYRKDLQSMGRSNFHRANQFDWNEISKMTYEVYRKCLENRRSKRRGQHG